MYCTYWKHQHVNERQTSWSIYKLVLAHRSYVCNRRVKMTSYYSPSRDAPFRSVSSLSHTDTHTYTLSSRQITTCDTHAHTFTTCVRAFGYRQSDLKAYESLILCGTLYFVSTHSTSHRLLSSSSDDTRPNGAVIGCLSLRCPASSVPRWFYAFHTAQSTRF